MIAARRLAQKGTVIILMHMCLCNVVESQERISGNDTMVIIRNTTPRVLANRWAPRS